jgi:hypothetical protein
MVSPSGSMASRATAAADQPGGELGRLGGWSRLGFRQFILGAAPGRLGNLAGGLCSVTAPDVAVCLGS